MANKYKALIKDLELQIDYLIAYSPSGLYWKQEYNIRSKMIDEALFGDYLPESTRTKILMIQDKIQQLRDGAKPEQPYYTEMKLDEPRKKIKVHDWGEDRDYYI